MPPFLAARPDGEQGQQKETYMQLLDRIIKEKETLFEALAAAVAEKEAALGEAAEEHRSAMAAALAAVSAPAMSRYRYVPLASPSASTSTSLQTSRKARRVEGTRGQHAAPPTAARAAAGPKWLEPKNGRREVRCSRWCFSGPLTRGAPERPSSREVCFSVNMCRRPLLGGPGTQAKC